MNTIRIVRARFIIPFMIKGGNSYSDFINHLTHLRNKWEPYTEEELQETERDLLESVTALVSSKEDTVFNTGRHFQYSHRGEGSILSGTYNSSDDEALPFEISDCGLFVFKSGVCFLWYEVNFKEVTESLFVSFVNEFKELSYPRLSIPDSNRHGKIPFCSENKGLQMGDFVTKELLGGLGSFIDFFAKRPSPSDGSDIPDKAIAFVYAIYAHSGYESVMYHFTNGFNSKYKVPDNINEQCFKPFNNVTCYMTANGCSYNAGYDETNRHFFFKTMKKKIMGDYFLMFILVLHQYYGIMGFNIRINSTLPAEFEKDRDMSAPETLLDTLNDITMDLNFFMSKNFFPSVIYFIKMSFITICREDLI